MTRRKKDAPPEVEWSVPAMAADVEDGPVMRSISPDAESARALARRLDLISLDGLRAEVKLERSGYAVHVTGKFDAKVTQSCVVTLEPVQSEISEEFEAWYADPAQAVSFMKERHDRKPGGLRGEKPILEESDDPEPIIGGVIDIGELVTQYLSLAINPYPHAEGAEYEHGGDKKRPGAGLDILKNPFAALKDWKARKK